MTQVRRLNISFQTASVSLRGQPRAPRYSKCLDSQQKRGPSTQVLCQPPRLVSKCGGRQQ
ncbi:hypothetical protein HPB50_004899 [Hyalomma asiaticum]|uniref:Uncharacterized protein n=1 Tax=Hyalomma asiaticum TaxID=266040 RepID=A0ACB7SCN1_HYAAI|nr:hypothetical protein HPB50_004899 [Hyalomma asiaticum]